MPTTEEIIARLENAKFLSKLDLCKTGAWHPDAKHLTVLWEIPVQKNALWLEKCTGYIPAADADCSVAPRRF